MSVLLAHAGGSHPVDVLLDLGGQVELTLRLVSTKVTH